jgi:hypothetical protein
MLSRLHLVQPSKLAVIGTGEMRHGIEALSGWERCIRVAMVLKYRLLGMCNSMSAQAAGYHNALLNAVAAWVAASPAVRQHNSFQKEGR